jgi:hypothetical protein
VLCSLESSLRCWLRRGFEFRCAWLRFLLQFAYRKLKRLNNNGSNRLTDLHISLPSFT